MEKLSNFCTKCNKELPISNFIFRKETGNYRNECNLCTYTRRKFLGSNQRWQAKNKEHQKKKNRIHGLKRHYNMTLEQYEVLFNSQDKKCAICKSETSNGKHAAFHVDHCHKTNTIRGILCGTCNVGLGSFKDNVESLESAIKYLKKAKND